MVGSPRSGTTWLQRLLGSHPEVATAQETDLFDYYVRSWADIWNQRLPESVDPGSGARHKGLAAVLTQAEFDELLRRNVAHVHARTLALKPGASVLVDKNPAYALHVPLLRRMIPDARIIHIVRDGRDVAASLMRASRGWARGWAPRGVHGAALTWRRHVEGARDARGGAGYLEIRYEDLRVRGPELLERCLHLCGLSATEAECGDIYRRLALGALKGPRRAGHVEDPLLWSGEVAARFGGAPPEPPGFFGEGRTGGWRKEWGARQRGAFDLVAGDLLVELGYEPSRRWARLPPGGTAWMSAEHAAWRVWHGVDHRLKKCRSA